MGGWEYNAAKAQDGEVGSGLGKQEGACVYWNPLEREGLGSCISHLRMMGKCSQQRVCTSETPPPSPPPILKVRTSESLTLSD